MSSLQNQASSLQLGSVSLEAKVDNLAQKLELFLTRGCPWCQTCSVHKCQHEETEAKLAAHSQMFDKLERRTWEIQRILDGMVKDNYEEKQHCTNQEVSVKSKCQPQKATTEKTQLPAKFLHANMKSPDVYRPPETNKQQSIKPLVLVVPSKKAAGAEQSQLEIKLESNLMAAPSAVVTQSTTKKKSHNEQSPTNHQEPKQAANHALFKRDEGPAGRGHVTGEISKEVKHQPVAKPKNQRDKLKITEISEMATAGQLLVSRKSQIIAGKFEALATQKPCKLAVPITVAESPALRHVSSCPESLQRLKVFDCQATELTGELAHHSTVQGKSFGVAEMANACPNIDCGIQIKVFPASQDMTRSRIASVPRICHKVIDDMPPQPAPFQHRCVSLRTTLASDAFLIHTHEVLGGGRFGKVHRCTEKSSGLKLAAKVINTRNAKEKEMALNEVLVMNQLNHANILQLYDAFETRNQVKLILEYVEGGELFNRIVDGSAPLTEVDAMVFVKQLCEGLHYMHQMFVLHLDLKPENILCVNHTSHQVKIIDFGLARRYRPREKLRVNFGTPEFLAPEVVNFDFVSFPTDMWTLGVVTYMLVSGMSPFLGDDDSQTLSNVLAVNWYFDEGAFEHISEEARDFISNLLIREKGGRLSAAQCLKHPWLNNISEKAKHNNIVLKSQVLLKKYMAKRLWKKNYIAIAAANRFKKIGSSGSLTTLGV